MPLIAYIPEKKFKPDSLEKIRFANEVLEDLTGRGYTPTLRQVYYKFVAAGKIPNTQKEYKNLGSLLNDARLCGLIDWDHMVDRTRHLQGTSHWESPADIIDSCYQAFRVDKWEGQEYYVEVWVEKDAQVDVVGHACEPLDVSYFSCRGYVSQSEMWGAARRLQYRIRDGRKAVIIHLGDHDPSGLDMTRDITERIGEVFRTQVEVRRIALNMDQIEELHPPPNPAKITDSRSAPYIAQFGHDSWELDALDPDYINNLITQTVFEYRDVDLYADREKLEEMHRRHLREVKERWEEIVKFLKKRKGKK